MANKQAEQTAYESFESMSTAVPVNGIMSEVTPDYNFNDTHIDEKHIPVLPVRDIVMFPFITVPLAVRDTETLSILEQAFQTNEAVLALTVASDLESVTANDLYRVGVLCVVAKIMDMPDGSFTVFLVAANRAKVVKFAKNTEAGFFASIDSIPEICPDSDDVEFAATLSSINDQYDEILNLYSETETKEMRFAMSQFRSPLKLFNFITCNSPISLDDRQSLLEENDMRVRASRLLNLLDKAFQMLRLKEDIRERTREDISRQQRDEFLQQQMQNIREELGDIPEDSDVKDLQDRSKTKDWNQDIASHFEKELKKLGRFQISTPEYGIQYTYLNTLLNLPWNKKTKTDFTIPHVEKILDRDHYGLDKVKDRIIEQVAVMKLRGDLKSPILCLYGPPGVGKTSLGKSVAEALGREYARISLGGLHDEAEIRGHRRTYIGAMPGRIITALEKLGTNNPVVVLDEIDKISKDLKGDPSAALLEVLDPEQNSRFHDNYIDVDYDLSDILFIATANSLSAISAPLLDRMELIELSGYILEEKIEILKRHLLPKALSDLGFDPADVTLTDDAIKFIVESYTRESGVRQLDKTLRSLLRRIARLKASDLPIPKSVDASKAKDILGKEEFSGEVYENNDYAGVVTGLAWTSSGGEILFIESSLSKGKGDRLTLTGNLGDVMKESAAIALQYVHSHCKDIGIPEQMFTEYNVHLHVPEGAIPKDGPSAGITMVTSLASAFTGRRVRAKMAMTGEMTLRGKVLPVGGIKEKILAAKRAGITDVMLSSGNKKDIDDIESRYISGLNFHYVDHIHEVLDFALLPDKAPL